VTGSARGIGAAIARRFAEAGAAVAVTDIRDDLAAETVRGIEERGGTAMALTLDARQESDFVRTIDAVTRAEGFAADRAKTIAIAANTRPEAAAPAKERLK